MTERLYTYVQHYVSFKTSLGMCFVDLGRLMLRRLIRYIFSLMPIPVGHYNL